MGLLETLMLGLEDLLVKSLVENYLNMEDLMVVSIIAKILTFLF